MTCGYPPPGYRWNHPGLEGYASADQIWLERCDLAYRRHPRAIVVLAHEILHVNTRRSHPWIYKWDDWYARVVVLPLLNRLRL